MGLLSPCAGPVAGGCGPCAPAGEDADAAFAVDRAVWRHMRRFPSAVTASVDGPAVALAPPDACPNLHYSSYVIFSEARKAEFQP